MNSPQKKALHERAIKILQMIDRCDKMRIQRVQNERASRFASEQEVRLIVKKCHAIEDRLIAAYVKTNTQIRAMYSGSQADTEKYNRSLELHEAYCNGYEKLLETIEEKGFDAKKVKVLADELRRMRFMDAPNKIGYYRANND